MAIDLASLTKLLSVLWLDVVLSGDNALVIGVAAATLPRHQQRAAIVFGLVLATVVRIGLASLATMMLEVPGLLFLGGLALLWVAYRLLAELLRTRQGGHGTVEGASAAMARATLLGALVSITIADVSMSIDNVLAVAAIARGDVVVLAIGLGLSIGLMGLGATLILRLMLRYPWISYLGVAILLAIGLQMTYEGWDDVASFLTRSQVSP